MILIPPDWTQDRLGREIERAESLHAAHPNCGTGDYYGEFLRLLRARLEHLRRVDIGLTV